MSGGSWREYTLSLCLRHGTRLRGKEGPMSRTRRLLLGASLVTLIAVLGVGQAALSAAGQGNTVEAPAFEVDPLWPKPLPNHWILGSTRGGGVDSRAHVSITPRGFPTLTARREAGLDPKPPTGECCAAAPPILEFDPDGSLANSWGGPAAGRGRARAHHARSVDDNDNVWIGGNGACPNDSTAGPACPRGT